MVETARPPKKAVMPKAPAKPAPPPKPAPTATGVARCYPLSETEVLAELLDKDEATSNVPLEPVSSTVVDFAKVVQALVNNASLEPFKDRIIQVVSNQPAKADLISGFLQQLDIERLTDAIQIRAHTEKKFKRLAARGDLTQADCIVLWKIASGIVAECQPRIQRDSKPVDSKQTVEKVDSGQRQLEDQTRQKWSAVSPQEREIIRKKLFNLQRETSLTIPPLTPPQSN